MQLSELIHRAIENAIRREYLDVSHKLHADGKTTVDIAGKQDVIIQPIGDKAIVRTKICYESALTFTSNDPSSIANDIVFFLISQQRFMEKPVGGDFNAS